MSLASLNECEYFLSQVDILIHNVKICLDKNVNNQVKKIYVDRNFAPKLIDLYNTLKEKTKFLDREQRRLMQSKYKFNEIESDVYDSYGLDYFKTKIAEILDMIKP